VLGIGFNSKKIQSFPSRAEIVGPFGTVEFALNGMKESGEKVLLVVLGYPYAGIPFMPDAIQAVNKSILDLSWSSVSPQF